MSREERLRRQDSWNQIKAKTRVKSDGVSRLLTEIFSQSPEDLAQLMSDSRLTHAIETLTGLQRQVLQRAGGVDDSRNMNISYRRQFFVYTKSRFQRSFGDGEIAGVLSGTQGGIYSNQKTVRVAQFYFFYGFAQI